MQFGDERLPEKFWAKLQPCPLTGCWLWSGAMNKNGYGSHGRRAPHSGSQLTHRFTYEVEFGALPNGTELDHRTCQTRCCSNPHHLEPVSHIVNIQRGRGAKKAVCVRGHELTEDNRRPANGGTVTRCAECVRIANDERCRLKREMTASRPKPPPRPKKLEGVCMRGHVKRFNGTRLQCDECARARYLREAVR